MTAALVGPIGRVVNRTIRRLVRRQIADTDARWPDIYEALIESLEHELVEQRNEIEELKGRIDSMDAWRNYLG